jgi:hypothetical protein
MHLRAGHLSITVSGHQNVSAANFTTGLRLTLLWRTAPAHLHPVLHWTASVETLDCFEQPVFLER